MRLSSCILAAGVALLAGCNQSDTNSSANEAAANRAQPARKHAYCFFKDEEMKGWAASRGGDGNITVKGKAHVKDPRYKPQFGEPTVASNIATLSPTIGQNDTGYATADNWWDVSATVPNSSAVTEVKVECGDKTVADLQVPPKS
jgi:hypothetical protein